MGTVTVGPSAGELLIRTKSAGRARKVAHDLTLLARVWSVCVHMEGNIPTLATLELAVSELEVRSGSGGVTPLSAIDRGQIKRNMLGALHHREHGTIEFTARAITQSEGGYQLKGPLRIAGHERDISVVVAVTDQGEEQHRLAVHYSLLQSDFGVKPYSAMLGALRVADEVEIDWSATVSVPAN